MEGKLRAIYYALEEQYNDDDKGYKTFTDYVKAWYAQFISTLLLYRSETALEEYEDKAEFILNEGLLPFILGDSYIGGYVQDAVDRVIGNNKDAILKKHPDILLTEERHYFDK